MSNEIRATIYLRSGDGPRLIESCAAAARGLGFRPFLDDAGPLGEATGSEPAVVIKPLRDDGPAVMLSAALDPNHPSSRFLDLLTELLPRMDVESVLMEMGPDLESHAGCTRAELARFDFKAQPGVGLRAAHASWFRAYLDANDARAFETQAGAVTLFIASPLLQALGLQNAGQALVSELFILRLRPDQGEVLNTWLQTLRWNSDQIYFAEQLTHLWRFRAHLDQPADSAQALRQALAPVRLMPTRLPVPLPPYALSLLAHPNEAPRAFGRNRYEQIIASLKSFTGRSYDAISPAEMQGLELTLLNTIRFAHPAEPCELLFRRVEDGIEMFIARPGLGSRTPASRSELEIAALVFKAVNADRARGFGHQESVWDGGVDAADITMNAGHGDLFVKGVAAHARQGALE